MQLTGDRRNAVWLVTGKYAQGGGGVKRGLIRAVVVYLESSCHLCGIALGEHNNRHPHHLRADRTVGVSALSVTS